jgi:hypothetical protein
VSSSPRHAGTYLRRAGRGAALFSLCLGAVLALFAAPSQAATLTFLYTGSEQTFIVPVGVTSIHVVAVGGSGGAGGSAAGGAAAQVTANLGVTPGQTLYVEVGGKGKNSEGGGGGGFNGGAAGGAGGSPIAGGGGGASDIRLLPGPSLSPDSRMIVAGGGGGGGGTGTEAGGGAGGAAESAGETSPDGDEGGGAGTQSAGGLGGIGVLGPGAEGERGVGGAGGSSCGPGGGGGGGGGGYFGGGGGGPGCEVLAGGGGGGGSSLVPAGGSLALASLSASPEVQITYSLTPPSIAIAAPSNGAIYTQGQAATAVYSCTAHEGAGVTACAGPVANGGALETSTLGQHTFTVNVEDTNGATASQSVTYNVISPKEGPPALPDTVLGSHPKKTISTKGQKVKVKFSFKSTTPGVTFKCKLDKGSFAPCTSPKSYKVKPGKHKFSVEALHTGVADPSPASFVFKVVRKH